MKHTLTALVLSLAGLSSANALGLSDFTGAAKDAAAPATGAATASADALKTQATALLKSVTDSAAKLMSGDALSQPIKDQLAKFTSSLSAGKDAAAADALAKITALKPTAEQTALLSELKSNFAVLALGRDFDPKDPASSGAVAKTVAALKAKDTAGTLTGLQTLFTQGKLTDDQKSLVAGLVSTYGGKLAGATEAVNKVSDKLKGFGL